jgi:membrane protein YqaA with SNARE-associated domain
MTDWMESFAEKPHAMYVLFALSFVESSFFPIPPDVLLIAIAIAKPSKAFKAALWCSVGSLLGGIFGYYIGAVLMDTIGQPILQFYGKENAMPEFIALYKEYGVMFLAIAAFTPVPYKVATIVSGAAHMDLTTFVLVSSIGRAGRFFLVAFLLYKFGAPIKTFIDKYFDILSIVFVVLLVAGFFAIKYLF